MMARNILLVEPGYRTKFPPLGLMKISSYHKMIGDNVTFVKGKDEDARYSDKPWDRIYVSTLFTYHWKATVDTIIYYKILVGGDLSRIFVGGIMSSLMADELYRETGVPPLTGVLSEPGALKDDNDLIVDDMIPDYRLFADSDQEYTLVNDSYFGYATRGCVRKCKFCGVPTLEPKFIEYKGIKKYIEGIREEHNEKTHLVLFDNNILWSKRFKEIIDDLIDLGFRKGAKLGYKNKAGQMSYRQRRVDFNQGIDARLMTKQKVRLLSKIALNPLRIAFDHIKDKSLYEEKVRLAADSGIANFSNYILYNYDDTPKDLWKRLKLNIDLNIENKLQIYSFPMKYIPLNAKNRSFINKPNWNWQYIRGVQRILNVVKGSVMPSKDFFFRAFGDSEEQFLKILHMPEKLLMFRGREAQKDEKDWTNKFDNLTSGEKKELLSILCEYKTPAKLETPFLETKSRKLKNILEYYIREKSEYKNSSLF